MIPDTDIESVQRDRDSVDGRCDSDTTLDCPVDIGKNTATSIKAADIQEKDTISICKIEEVNIEDANDHLSSAPDGGYGWICVFASFLVHIVTIGVQAEYGVFQQAYKESEEFKSVSNLGIAFVGSLGAAMVGLGGIPTGWIADKYGYNLVCAVGGIVEMLGLLLASFSNKVGCTAQSESKCEDANVGVPFKQYWHLLLTHGFMAGLGVAIAYFPALSVVSQWFDKRRGIAVGIAVSGSGVGGLGLAPLTRMLISKVGWRWSLRITAFIVGLLVLVSAILIRVRYRAPRRTGGFGVVKDKAFGRIYGVALFGSFGYFIPFFFVPAFATAHGVSASSAALLVGLLNGASAVGRLAWGFSADALGHVNTLVMCICASALSILVFWPFATSFGALLGFVLCYGGFIGGFVSLLPSGEYRMSILATAIWLLISLLCVITVIATFYAHTGHIATITGMLYSGFFLGNLFGAPIAGAMMDHFTTYKDGEKDINFLPSILFGGVLMAIAASFAISVRMVSGGGRVKKG